MSYKDYDHLRDELWELYTTKGRQAVADRTGLSYNTVGHVIRRLGFYDDLKKVHMIRTSQPTIKNPFLVDSQSKYYVLGHILGDGSVYLKGGINNWVLNLSSSDYEYIESLRNFFSSDLKIKGPNRGNYTVDIYDRPIVQWLRSYGIKERKSKEGILLPHIPEEYKHSFLLGLLDSDGCIQHANYGKQIYANWCGHEKYMVEVMNLLNEYKPNWNRRKRDGLIVIKIYTSTLEFLHKAYRESPIVNNRKYGYYVDYCRREGIEYTKR